MAEEAAKESPLPEQAAGETEAAEATTEDRAKESTEAGGEGEQEN
jgi:hypothetical protein